jgi:hypothetical protein
VTCLSSAHRYVNPTYKDNDGDFRRSVGGLNSIGLTVPVAWTIEMMKIKNDLSLSSAEIGTAFHHDDAVRQRVR